MRASSSSEGGRKCGGMAITGSPAVQTVSTNLPLMMAAPPRKADAAESARSFVYLQPEPGTVLMWESWLRHEVPANAAKKERISVSFNYAWR